MSEHVYIENTIYDHCEDIDSDPPKLLVTNLQKKCLISYPLIKIKS